MKGARGGGGAKNPIHRKSLIIHPFLIEVNNLNFLLKLSSLMVHYFCSTVQLHVVLIINGCKTTTVFQHTLNLLY